MWEIFLVISLCINTLLFFYIRWLLSNIKRIYQDLEFMSERVDNFSSHVSSLYELEMFYGDESLQSLMAHAKELTSTLAEIYLIIEKEEKEIETNSQAQD